MLRHLRRIDRPKPPDASLDVLRVDPMWRVAPGPRTIWIELTSRCPYDCVFCSRKAIRGHGRHLPFELYDKLLSGLRHVATIRLNYSGESLHYPRLLDAVTRAADTGAVVELVSVPAAVSQARLTALVDAGVSRLTVSLHTLDAVAFRTIYRFGDLSPLLANLRHLAKLRGASGRPFILDLAMVAMYRNLEQLVPIGRLAEELGIAVVAVHPVIQRDANGEDFSAELVDERPGHDFSARLRLALDEARMVSPSVAFQLSTPEICGRTAPIGGTPIAWPDECPAGAEIVDCDQSPWETLHVLADGTVVTCEVRDRSVIGDLKTASLQDIWHGDALNEFRRAYAEGADADCRRCPYKRIRLPQTLRASVSARESNGQLLVGWHTPDHEQAIVWSDGGSGHASLALADDGNARRLVVRGMLPPGARGNGLDVYVDGTWIGHVIHRRETTLSFERAWPLPPRREAGGVPRRIAFSVTAAWNPSAEGKADSRRLGFALVEAALR